MFKQMNELFEMVNKIPYTREIPKESENYARENGFIVIVGGSDDLMYCYGADSYMTDYIEHSYGWDGETFDDIDDKQLQKEANQLGLEIFWCGKNKSRQIENYDIDKQGAFSYKVNDGIEFKDFLVMEDDSEVYCTGIIIKLPEDFKSYKGAENV